MSQLKDNLNIFMAEKTKDLTITQFSHEEHSEDNSQARTAMWREFVDSTTLHGIRYVFLHRHILIRFVWIVIMLVSGGYYVFLVQAAFYKYYSRPINTVLTHEHVSEMKFPAVTICPLNFFAKSKLLMRDDNPLFASKGLNISSCAVTAGVRGDRPCGLSLLCCCAPPEFEDLTAAIPNCTAQYKQDLLEVMQQTLHRPDVDTFYRYFSQDIEALFGPVCEFGWDGRLDCSPEDFVSTVAPWGVCYTFNSGTDDEIKTVDSGGVTDGLSVMLDVQTHEYTYGKYSVGFKVLIHGQGEYIDEWAGINVGPGQHAVIALSEKRVCYIHQQLIANQ